MAAFCLFLAVPCPPPQVLALYRLGRERDSSSYALGAGRKDTPDLVFDPGLPAASALFSFGGLLLVFIVMLCLKELLKRTRTSKLGPNLHLSLTYNLPVRRAPSCVNLHKHLNYIPRGNSVNKF